jgi:hypothetical protein
LEGSDLIHRLTDAEWAAAQASPSSSAWKTKTSEEVLADINACLEAAKVRDHQALEDEIYAHGRQPPVVAWERSHWILGDGIHVTITSDEVRLQLGTKPRSLPKIAMTQLPSFTVPWNLPARKPDERQQKRELVANVLGPKRSRWQ